MIAAALKRGLFQLLPAVCALCGRPVVAENMCADCTRQLPVIAQSCPHCGIGLAPAVPCPDCMRSPPIYDQCIAGLHYRYPVDRLLHAMKYHGQLQLLAGLVTPLRLRLRELTALPDYLVPVPLHRRRLSIRGYNQAGLIAQELSRQLGIPCADRLLSRRRNTEEQARLKPAARQANVSKAFQLNTGADIEGRHVAIIDDVLTTGATCDELARLLKQAGARRVAVWTLARAGRL